MKQKYTVLPGIPPTDGEYRAKQLYSPRKHTPMCQAPNAFSIYNTILQFNELCMICGQ